MFQVKQSPWSYRVQIPKPSGIIFHVNKFIKSSNNYTMKEAKYVKIRLKSPAGYMLTSNKFQTLLQCLHCLL